MNIMSIIHENYLQKSKNVKRKKIFDRIEIRALVKHCSTYARDAMSNLKLF